MSEIKSNRAWREEAEALRRELAEALADVTHWNTTFLEAREIYENQLASVTAERDNWKEIAGARYAPAAYRLVEEQLAASQLREQQLREALEEIIYYLDRSGSRTRDGNLYCSCCESGQGDPHKPNCVLSLPHDGTALKQYGAKLLRDAAKAVWSKGNATADLNRMADELEGKK